MITISHGSDFWGVDVVDPEMLSDLAVHLPCVLPAADCRPLVDTLQAAIREAQEVDAEQAAVYARLLHRAATTRRGLPRAGAALAARLGVAAATAARAVEPWTMTIEKGAAQPAIGQL